MNKYSNSLKLNLLEEIDNYKLFSIELESSKMYNDIVTMLKSNSNVVAVIDQGVDKTHNDLAGNISPLSFDMLTGTSPSVFSGNHPHGTRIAGIISAIKNNNRQVVGVAPNSKIMSASLNALATSLISSQFASGINWAWQDGADVISCSWGDYGGSITNFTINSALLENAIEYALQYGRNGKGCVVVFTAGNTGLQRIDYPGNSHEDIIAVGGHRQ